MNLLIFYLLLIFEIVDCGSCKLKIRRSIKTTNGLSKFRRAVFGQTLINRRNVEYFVIVSLGVPPKSFKVIFDSGSKMLWVPKTGCESIGANTKFCESGENLFDPSQSKTANVTDQSFNVYYGTGSVSGTLYRDYLSFGDTQTKNHIHLPEKVIFGAGEQLTISETGILGLALADEKSANNSIFWQAIKQNVFKQPMFTTFFKKCSLKESLCENNGMVTFGDFDEKHCEPVHIWLPILKESQLWQLKIDGFQIGDNAKTNYPVTALIDSGTSDLVISTNALNQLVKSINAQKYKGKYIVDCKKRFTFNIQIQNQTFEMTSDDLMFEVGAEYCQLAVNDNSSGLWSELWILGDPFYRKFCLTHNFNGTIGVAHHRK